MKRWAPYLLLIAGGLLLIGRRQIGELSEEILALLNSVQRRVLSWRVLILQEAQRWNVAPSLIAAVMHIESGGNPNARSPKAAIGLMQVLCTTAQMMGYQGTCNDLYNPNINIFYGTQYLKRQLDRYGGRVDYALAAYNAGTAYGSSGQFSNQKYVNDVMRHLTAYRSLI